MQPRYNNNHRNSRVLRINLFRHREGTWQYGSVGITAEEDVWIAFQGSVLSAGGGDIGLDDITVSKEACGVQPPEAEVSPSEPPGEQRDIRRDGRISVF